MTVAQIADVLASHGIDDALSEAFLIAEHLSGKNRAFLYAAPEFDVSGRELEEILAKRVKRYPLQYLFGTWEFCGLPFRVTPDVLIPRPDTEILAERAAALLPKGGRILDLCTGTGCILGAALKLSGNDSGVGVDLFESVVELAKENLSALGLSCDVLLGDATTDLFPPNVLFDVITANPPYVTADEMLTLAPELSYEPSAALTDGGDGLSILRKIIEIYKNHLVPGGVMLLEHGYRQSEAVVKLANDNAMTAEVLRDYGGNLRAVLLRNR